MEVTSFGMMGCVVRYAREYHYDTTMLIARQYQDEMLDKCMIYWRRKFLRPHQKKDIFLNFYDQGLRYITSIFQQENPAAAELDNTAAKQIWLDFLNRMIETGHDCVFTYVIGNNTPNTSHLDIRIITFENMLAHSKLVAPDDFIRSINGMRYYLKQGGYFPTTAKMFYEAYPEYWLFVLRQAIRHDDFNQAKLILAENADVMDESDWIKIFKALADSTHIGLKFLNMILSYADVSSLFVVEHGDKIIFEAHEHGHYKIAERLMELILCDKK